MDDIGLKPSGSSPEFNRGGCFKKKGFYEEIDTTCANIGSSFAVADDLMEVDDYRFSGWETDQVCRKDEFMEASSTKVQPDWSTIQQNVPEKEERQYQIYDVSRKVKMTSNAKCIEELTSLFSTESKNIRLVLENDGTEVEDDAYLKSLKDDAKLMFLLYTQKWCKYDIIEERSAINVARALVKNLDYAALLSDDDLEKLSEIDVQSFAKILNVKESQLEQIKDKSFMVLDEKNQTTEHIGTLSLVLQGARLP